jgi:hypothetical protein
MDDDLNINLHPRLCRTVGPSVALERSRRHSWHGAVHRPRPPTRAPLEQGVALAGNVEKPTRESNPNERVPVSLTR